MTDIRNEIEGLLGSQISAVQQKANLADFLARLSPDARIEAVRWVFEEHIGYTDVREWAGLEYMKKEPLQGRAILTLLVNSDDPDNREVALSVLSYFQEDWAFVLVKSLLRDPWPYIRLGASDILKELYPLEVVSALRELQNHKEDWVRKAIQERLNLMNAK